MTVYKLERRSMLRLIGILPRGLEEGAAFPFGDGIADMAGDAPQVVA